MSNIEDTLWGHLVEQHGADRARVCPPARSRTGRSPVVIGMAATGLAAVAAAAVLVVSATTDTPPAYALTPHADGSYTLTINDIATAVPEVNAQFAALGINAKVIPVTSNCTDPNTWPLLAPDANMTISQTITIENADIPAGTTGVIAAEQTPSGIRFVMGAVDSSTPLPSCIDSNAPPLTVIPTPPAATGGN